MADDKIKIGDIEGSKDAVLDFIKESKTDIPSLLNAPKDVKIPFWSVVIASGVFLLLVMALAVFKLDEAVFKILSLLCIAVGILLVCIVYMAYRSKTLIGIIAVGEVILLSISLGIYSPKDVVGKIGEKLEKYYNQ